MLHAGNAVCVLVEGPYLNPNLCTLMKPNGCCKNKKCIKPEITPDELNMLGSYIACEASIVWFELSIIFI